MLTPSRTFPRAFLKDQPKVITFVRLVAAICLLIGMAARMAAVRPMTNDPMVQAPFHDDGFYYLQIARNVATQGKFTFDGINRTNGFHPLWQLLLALTARFSVDDFGFIRLVMYLSIALFALTGVLLFKFVAGYGGSSAGLAAVILWSFSPDLVMWQNQGMENTIFLPILLMSLIQIDRFIRLPNSLREAFALGIAFGSIMWSRSDSLLFVLLALVGIGLYLWRKSKSVPVQPIRSLSVVLGITFCFGIGYLLFNYAAAGSFLSVSGVVKIGDSSDSSWRLAQTIEAFRLHLSMVWDLFSSLGGLTWWGFNWRILPFKVIVFAWGILVAAWWVIEFSKDIRRNISRVRRWDKIGVSLLVVYTLLHTGVLVTLMRSQLRWTPWYIVPQVLTILVVIPLVFFSQRIVKGILRTAAAKVAVLYEKTGLADGNRKHLQAIYVICAACLSVAILVACTWALQVPVQGWYQRTASPATEEPRFELAVWLNDHIPPDAKVGMFDAGITGYFAHAHVINLDGLVNSPEFVVVRRTGAYADYVIKNRIEYVIYYYFPPYTMNWWQPTDDSRVCHKLLHMNKNAALWGAEKVGNYFQVVALRYDGNCQESWEPGFPRDALPPE